MWPFTKKSNKQVSLLSNPSWFQDEIYTPAWPTMLVTELSNGTWKASIDYPNLFGQPLQPLIRNSNGKIFSTKKEAEDSARILLGEYKAQHPKAIARYVVNEE